jgi:hypothetical protein
LPEILSGGESYVFAEVDDLNNFKSLQPARFGIVPALQAGGISKNMSQRSKTG